MDLKGYYVHRIMAGATKLDCMHGNYEYILLKSPTCEARYMAEELCIELYNFHLENGALTRKDLEVLLDKRGIWTFEDDDILDTLVKNTEEIKTKSVSLSLHTNELSAAKKALRKTEEEIEKRLNRKHSCDYLCADYIAAVEKNKFLFASAIYSPDHTQLFPCLTDFDNTFVMSCMVEYSNKKIPYQTIRELARTEPWRSIWASKSSNSNIFPNTVPEYTEEQQQLVNWTLLYDNIYECMERPSTNIINDDDLLDGWLILQKRKREAEENGRQAESLMGAKAKSGHGNEVFIPVGDSEKAKMVDALNTPESARIKRARLKKVEKDGYVLEQNMPDVKRQLQMDAVKRMADNLRK